jgi:hypothetical protein
MFLTYDDVETGDNGVRLFVILQRLSGATQRIQKRTSCVALADLHPKGTDLDSLMSRVRSYPGIADTSSETDVRTSLTNLIYNGRKWRKIIQLCATIHGSNKESDFSGAIWLLDKGS